MVIENVLVDSGTDGGARRASCGTAEETGNHGARESTENRPDRPGNRADRRTRFSTGERRRDSARGAGDTADGVPRTAVGLRPAESGSIVDSLPTAD